MRILVISNMYPSDAAPSFGIFVKNQVEALMNKGNQVDVAAVTNPEAGKKSALKKYSKWMWSTFRRLRATGRNVDVIHAHYAFPSGVPARMMAKRYGIPYVVTCHGGDLNKMAQKGRFFRKQTKRILQDAAHVIVVGEDLLQQMLDDFDVPEDRVSMLSMGVDRRVFHPRPQMDVQEMLELSPYEKHILYVGNVIEEKGIGDLLEAFPKVKYELPNARLHVIGPARQEDYLQKLKDRLAELEVEEAVTFHGARSQQEVAEWMAASDLFVLPSHTEGFGLVAVEAMACGTPVVGTNTGGLGRVLSDGAGAVTEPKHPVSLAEQMAHVLEDRYKRAEMIEKGYEKAAANDAEAVTDQVLEIYWKAQQRTEKS
ncbi:glycosyltransferase [Salibacterium halotolerans]|uniref:Glycosyltransferase involved in cell wall bisynthesis n=1 Tax=Salibacterium halotolerans TaxID=1884432 RepID=A0A1I5WWU8_9BACI|nr:glycosyltransferase [Salibacterium halotolerans]SFQ24160.1 Glycosyltransferase involved in cell wall bisynthesis [Salibacterium halotolerans]